MYNGQGIGDQRDDLRQMQKVYGWFHVNRSLLHILVCIDIFSSPRPVLVSKHTFSGTDLHALDLLHGQTLS